MLYYLPRHWPVRALCDTGQQRASVCRFDGNGRSKRKDGGLSSMSLEEGVSKLYATVREQWVVCPGSLLVLLGRRMGWAYLYIHTRCYL